MVAQTNDFWGQFGIPGSPQQEQQQQSQPQEMMQAEQEEAKENEFSWDTLETPQTYQGEIDPTAEQSTIGYMVQNLVANTSRLAEQYLGRTGNIEKMGRDIAKNYPASTGFLGWSINKLIGQENWDRLLESNSQIFPTSQELKHLSQEGTGGYTKAKTKGQEKFQGVVEDIGSTLRRGPQALNDILRTNIGIPVAANVAKEIVQETGFGEDKANVAKGLVWTGLTLANSVNGPQYASQLMNQGRNGMPTNVHIDVPRMQNRLNNVSNDPQILHADPRSALARQQIAAIQNDIANGQTSNRAMMNSYDGLNAAKRSRGMFDLARSDREFARRQIDKVRDALRDEIMESGAAHPEAINNWREGIQAWATVHRSNAITHYVDDLLNSKYAKMLSGPAAALFGVGAYGLSKTPLTTATGAVGAPALYKTGQLLYRAYNNPQLRQYYFDAIGAAITENTPSFISNYLKLNKGLGSADNKKHKKK